MRQQVDAHAEFTDSVCLLENLNFDAFVRAGKAPR